MMRGKFVTAGLIAAVLTFGWGLSAPVASAPQYDPEDEWHGLPEDEGRDVLYYNCVACHSMGTIMQQRLNRSMWNRTIDRMINDMGMPEPPEEEREIILDYLEEHFGQDSPR